MSRSPKAVTWSAFNAARLGGIGMRLAADFPGTAVAEPSLDRIIAQLQLCIVDARTLQLKMLERILSIAVLKAYEARDKVDRPHQNGGSIGQ
jgi:hypothetical protein